jgi:hypothetical protein
LRDDPIYKEVEARVREEARARARIDDLQKPPVDPIAAVLARLDARLKPALKGPVKVRHPAASKAPKPGRVA